MNQDKKAATMNRARTMLSRALLLALPLATLAVAASVPAHAQDAPPPPPAPPGDMPPPPPDAYIATVQPEYFEGRPVYLYNGNWYFHDAHGGWNYYRTEPAFLRDRRSHWNDHARYHYNRR
jgi:hypothetical protein